MVLHGLGRVRAAFHWQRGGLQGGVPHLSPLVPFADGTACLLAQTKRFLGEQPARALVFLFFFPKTVSFLYFFFPSRVCDFPSGHILFLFCVLWDNMDVLYKFNRDMNWQSLKGEQILGRVFVVSAAVLPGHRAVHFFFVNYVSSPPGLPDNFFLYFFFSKRTSSFTSYDCFHCPFEFEELF